MPGWGNPDAPRFYQGDKNASPWVQQITWRTHCQKIGGYQERAYTTQPAKGAAGALFPCIMHWEYKLVGSDSMRRADVALPARRGDDATRAQVRAKQVAKLQRRIASEAKARATMQLQCEALAKAVESLKADVRDVVSRAK